MINSGCYLLYITGNPKTLTPVRRPPLRTGSADHLWTSPWTTCTDPLYEPPPKLSNSRSPSPANRLLTYEKFQMLPALCKCNRRFRLGRIAIFFVMANTVYERPNRLQEASTKPLRISKFVLFPLYHFCSTLYGPFSRGFVNSFQASQFAQQNYRYNELEQPKNTSWIARLSHERKASTFLLFAMIISICKNPGLLHLHSVTLEISPTTRVIYRRQPISGIFTLSGVVRRGGPYG